MCGSRTTQRRTTATTKRIEDPTCWTFSSKRTEPPTCPDEVPSTHWNAKHHDPHNFVRISHLNFCMGPELGAELRESPKLDQVCKRRGHQPGIRTTFLWERGDSALTPMLCPAPTRNSACMRGSRCSLPHVQGHGARFPFRLPTDVRTGTSHHRFSANHIERSFSVDRDKEWLSLVVVCEGLQDMGHAFIHNLSKSVGLQLLSSRGFLEKRSWSNFKTDLWLMIFC